MKQKQPTKQKAGHPFQVSNPKVYRYVRIQVTETWSGEQFTHFTELELLVSPRIKILTILLYLFFFFPTSVIEVGILKNR